MQAAAQQRLLYALAALCLTGAAGTVFWAASGIDSVSLEYDPRVLADETLDPESAERESAVAAVDLTRRLRAPLYDPPPQPPKAKPVVKRSPAPQPPPKPKLELTLVGTIIDAKERLAIIVDADGNFDVKGVGESLELQPPGVRIDQIEAEHISLQFQGSESTLRLDKQQQRRNASSRRSGNRRRIP